MAPAMHPLTMRIEQAEYLDNYYGHHRYAVRFADGTVWPIEQLLQPPEQDKSTTGTDTGGV